MKTFTLIILMVLLLAAEVFLASTVAAEEKSVDAETIERLERPRRFRSVTLIGRFHELPVLEDLLSISLEIFPRADAEVVVSISLCSSSDQL